MSESLSWMQTGDTLALSGELDQDVAKLYNLPADVLPR